VQLLPGSAVVSPRLDIFDMIMEVSMTDDDVTILALVVGAKPSL